MKTTPFLITVVLVVVGCGDDGGGMPVDSGMGGDAGDPIPASVGGAFDGVYMMTSATRNDTSCALEGASILDTWSEPYFYARYEPTDSSVRGSSCTDEADCRSRAASGDTTGMLAFLFNRQEASEIASDITRPGSVDGELCTGGGITSRLGLISGGSMSIEERFNAAPDYPVGATGECEVEPAREGAEGAPCATYRVFIGTRVGDLVAMP